MSGQEASRPELQIGPYATRVLRRWWVVVLCVVAAVALAAIGGRGSRHATTQAQSTLYVGQPLTFLGDAVPSTVYGNPSLVTIVAHERSTVEAGARAAGLTADALASHITIQVAGRGTVASTRGAYAPIYTLAVQGPWTAAQVVRAADGLAQAVVMRTSEEATGKITALTQVVADYQGRVADLVTQDARTQTALAALARDSSPQGVAAQAGLVAAMTSNASLEAQLRDKLAQARVNLQLAHDVEASRIVTPAVAARIETASGSTSLTLAALAGLIVGVLVAAAPWPARRLR